MKKRLKNFLQSFCVLFLPIFMFGIFGPSEVFFGNYSELGFVYGEFGWKFLVAGVVGTIVSAIILSLIPERIRMILEGMIWGVSVAAYIQVMFLNRGLEQIGVTAEGYQPAKVKVIQNGIIWGIIIIAAIVLAVLLKNKWNRIVTLVSLVLILMQGIGYVSLFISADKEAFEYPESELCLDMSEQFTVSSDENVIMLILDNVANEWFEEARVTYPDILDQMNDFTYYTNADCNYYGTYPSVVHMLTGNPLDVELSVNDYFKQCWSNERTDNYYDLLREHNYKINVFTHLSEVLTGGNSLDLIADKIDNVVEKNAAVSIDYNLLYKTMLEMSLYRYVPDGMKPQFDVGMEQYQDIVTHPENEMMYSNPNFYNTLLDKGLTVVEDKNYFTVNHLNGGHEFINDEYCQYNQDVSRDQTIKGMFVMVNEYLKQLKEAGVYDNAAILVLADHGTGQNAQPILFLKRPHETHDVIQETNAPVTYDELVPTIVKCLGEDSTEFGETFDDFKQDEVRHRKFYDRAYDGNFPSVKRYDGMEGGANVYREYQYDGNLQNIQQQYYDALFSSIPMVDSYY